MNRPLILCLGVLLACASASQADPALAPPVAVPFSYLDGRALRIPVKIGDGQESQFILDTGIGVSIISTALAKKLACQPTREYKGKRMSGQELSVPIGRIPSLSFGGAQENNAEVGIWDLKGFFPDTPAYARVEGFLSLTFFRNRPFTIDYSSSSVVLETPATLEKRRSEGKTIPLRLEEDQSTSLTAWLALLLPRGAVQDQLTTSTTSQDSSSGGRHGGRGRNRNQDSSKNTRPKTWAELDTGSQSLILNSKFMNQLGVDPGGSEVKTKEGTDETGQAFRRFFAQISGNISLAADKDLTAEHPQVMFQKIAFDAIVGQDFLSQYSVTFDLAHSEAIFKKN